VSGYPGTPLAQKLDIKAGRRLFTRAAPADYLELLAPLPERMRTVMRVRATTDFLYLFARRRGQLERALYEATIRELALPLGLVDIEVRAVHATWSGLKLVVRKGARPATRTR
jgi:hypothetical protein